MTKNSRQKFKYLEDKRAFKMKQKAFFIILKGLSLKQMKQIFWERENPTLSFIKLHLVDVHILTDHCSSCYC